MLMVLAIFIGVDEQAAYDAVFCRVVVHIRKIENAGSELVVLVARNGPQTGEGREDK